MNFIKTFGDYPLTEIAKNADMNFQTLKKICPQLEENKVIVETNLRVRHCTK